MPLPIDLSHRLVKKQADVMKANGLSWLRPDAKSQVTFQYENDKPKSVDTVVLSSPNQLFNTITTSDPSCNGFLDGNINIQTTGGTAPYTYLWSNGDTNQILQNIGAGQYLLTVTDSNNCVKLDSISLSEPALITYSPNVIDALCYGDNNGSISVNVFGGTLPYFYNWSTGDSTSSCRTSCNPTSASCPASSFSLLPRSTPSSVSCS